MPKRKTVARYDRDTGELLEVYPSLKDAAKAMYGKEKNNQSAICHVCRGRHPTACGFVWRYVREKEEEGKP